MSDIEVNWEQVVEYVLGSCKSESEIAETFNLSDWDIGDKLNELDVWKCQLCGWWHTEDEMFNSEICEDCEILENE